MHVLDWNLCDFALTCAHNDIPVEKDFNGSDAQTEESFDWPHSFVNGFLDIDFENVSSFSANIHILVKMVYAGTSELSLHIAEISIQGLNLLIHFVHCEDLDCALCHCNKLITVFVEEENFINDFSVWSSV